MIPVQQASLSALEAYFAARTLSPTEICDAYLARVEAHDPQIRAFVHIDRAGARAAAEASTARYRAGTPLSPLDGMPIAVKANIAVENLPLHAGIAAWRSRVAPKDAACIGKLRTQGAVILGLLNMHEAAFGGTTDNTAFGRTENPWSRGRTAGGSSGGSAASVAAGFCAAALGTDTLGSVRIPSAYCGIFGHKPACGTMNLEGIVPLCARYDQLGTHTRSIADTAILFHALSGLPIMKTQAVGKIAVLRTNDQVDIEPVLLASLDRAAAQAERAGYKMENMHIADLDYSRLRRLALLVVEAEAQLFYNETMKAQPEDFSEGLRRMLGWAAAQPASRLHAARVELAEFAKDFAAILAPFTAILAPVTPQQAFRWTDPVPANQADLTALASIAGLPALAMPAGSAFGLPLAVQLIATTDETLLSTAARITLQETAACAFP